MKIIKTWRVGACLTVALIAAASGASGVAQGAPRAMKGGTVPAAAASTSLCRSIGQVDHLVVRRVDEFPRNGIHFSFPVVTAVTEVASARDVAKVVCALPRIPMGVMSCVIDLGIYYRLGFTAANATFPTVVVGATGCQTVRGIGPTRWVADSSFWRRLGNAMGLKTPTYATFRGTGGGVS
ncbi:MAG: hypothetical protein ABSA14_05050 [Acidimicrobiales bacterium]|jgi:hypothetical protein